MLVDERLPIMAVVPHPTTKDPILIHRGVRGYTPIPPWPQASVDAFNARYGAEDEAVREALLIGSMYGWEVPGAQFPGDRGKTP